MKRFPAFLAAAVFLSAAQGHAQDDGTAVDGQPIVVEGTRDSPPNTTQSVRAITEADGENLARFESDVCPAVAGLPAHWASVVVALMRDAVNELDVDLAPEECVPNMTLIVTDDGRALVAGLAKADARLFGKLSALEMGELRENTGPVWTWQTTRTMRADGAPVGGREDNIGSGVMVRGATMSRLSSPVRKEIEGSFVVLDADSIDGLTLKQIAHFAVMRGLAPTRDAQNGRFGFDSILNLFGGGPVMEGLTPFDREYLASVYRGGNGFTYAQKTRQVAQDVARSEKGRNDRAD